MSKRVFLVVLDSFGVGEEPDAHAFGDWGVNTLASIRKSPKFHCPNLARLGLFHLDGVQPQQPQAEPIGAFARLQERSMGKDTTIGHWEIAGVESPAPLPTYPDGFPPEIIQEFEQRTGRAVLCNKPYSEVLKDYGEEHLRTGALIVYTSADSVFQIAAHEDIVPPQQLYEYCRIARSILTGKHGVGRVIARPFEGTCRDDFRRTPRRHDYSLVPPHDTMLDAILAAGKQTIGVGKIHDIFAGKGIGETIRTSGNTEGLQVTLELADRDFEGLAFVNLVDFDMLYGHRRNIAGYAAAAAEFNDWLPGFMAKMRPGDILMVTADHGCDPSYTKTTDHTREHVPFLIYGDEVKPGVNLHTRYSFATIADTVCKALGVDYCPAGCGVYDEIAR